MTKIGKGSRKTLADRMKEEPTMGERRPSGGGGSIAIANVSAQNGDKPPEIPEEIQAMMIITGVSATWVLNMWRVEGPIGKRSGVSARNDFEEWRTVINSLAPSPFIGDLT